MILPEVSESFASHLIQHLLSARARLKPSCLPSLEFMAEPRRLSSISVPTRFTVCDHLFNPSVEVDPVSIVPFAAKPLARILGIPFLP